MAEKRQRTAPQGPPEQNPSSINPNSQFVQYREGMIVQIMIPTAIINRNLMPPPPARPPAPNMGGGVIDFGDLSAQNIRTIFSGEAGAAAGGPPLAASLVNTGASGPPPPNVIPPGTTGAAAAAKGAAGVSAQRLPRDLSWKRERVLPPLYPEGHFDFDDPRLPAIDGIQGEIMAVYITAPTQGNPRLRSPVPLNAALVLIPNLLGAGQHGVIAIPTNFLRIVAENAEDKTMADQLTLLCKSGTFGPRRDPPPGGGGSCGGGGSGTAAARSANFYSGMNPQRLSGELRRGQELVASMEASMPAYSDQKIISMQYEDGDIRFVTPNCNTTHEDWCNWSIDENYANCVWNDDTNTCSSDMKSRQPATGRMVHRDAPTLPCSQVNLFDANPDWAPVSSVVPNNSRCNSLPRSVTELDCSNYWEDDTGLWCEANYDHANNFNGCRTGNPDNFWFSEHPGDQYNSVPGNAYKCMYNSPNVTLMPAKGSLYSSSGVGKYVGSNSNSNCQNFGNLVLNSDYGKSGISPDGRYCETARNKSETNANRIKNCKACVSNTLQRASPQGGEPTSYICSGHPSGRGTCTASYDPEPDCSSSGGGACCVSEGPIKRCTNKSACTANCGTEPIIHSEDPAPFMDCMYQTLEKPLAGQTSQTGGMIPLRSFRCHTEEQGSEEWLTDWCTTYVNENKN